jgi:lipoyl-dependent peroxiredoxin
MADRTAHVTWSGSLLEGAGTITSVGSGAFGPLDVTWAARTEDSSEWTSPEELLAAAHATCFVTSLGSELARLGTPPERMYVRCTITMDEVEGAGHRIVASDISARAVAPGADPASFARAADEANAGCPFSALIRATATVTVEATLDEGGS